MRRIGFRTRLLLVLALFAAVPSILLAAVYIWSASSAFSELSGTEPWERVAESGRAALDAVENKDLSEDQRRLLAQHREALSVSLTNARRLAVYAGAAPAIAIFISVVALILIGVATTRVAGHLSRQLSRPLHEIVQWTEMMARGEPLPETAHVRGAPEFEVLRQRMRRTARELATSRERAVEAERLRAFRESARQVAHELKNALTPVRFAVSRLQNQSTIGDAETVEVLDMETRRLEGIARSFAQFGRLPEGPVADVDMAELITYTARSVVPEEIPVSITVADDVPLIRGHYDALSRALANVLINAVDACRGRNGAGITLRVSSSGRGGGAPADGVTIEVADEGAGIPASQLQGIWEPYVTHKPGGTGLGLAIVRQTVVAHGGTVDAESIAGVGTVIRFHLPLRHQPPGGTPSAAG